MVIFDLLMLVRNEKVIALYDVFNVEVVVVVQSLDGGFGS